MGMKKVLGLMILLFLTVPAMAQQEPPSADQIIARMQSKLNLTQDQVAAVKPIIEKYSSEREELRQTMDDGTADRDTIRTQMKQLREAETKDLSQVLSSQQMGFWKQMMAKHKHPGGEGGTNAPQETGGNNSESSGNNNGG